MKKSAQTTIQRMALFALDIIDVVLLHFLFVFFCCRIFRFASFLTPLECFRFQCVLGINRQIRQCCFVFATFFR